MKLVHKLGSCIYKISAMGKFIKDSGFKVVA